MSLPIGPPTSPTATTTATPGTQRLPARQHTRRSTQVRRNAVVLAWLATAGLLALLVGAGPLASWGAWLPLHTLLLGGIGSAITIWSAHFADTLLHRPALGGPRLLDARLAGHSLGTLLVLVGITASRPLLAACGVAAVMACALTGVVAITVQYRRAVAPRLAALAVHYAVALALLAAGAALGYLVSWATTHGRAELADRLYLAHTTTMLLGFVGTTVLGTLTVLWPTMLRTKMETWAPAWTTRGLPALVAGTVLVASSGLWRPLAGLGTLVYLAGAAGVVVPALTTARRVRPTSFATASTAGAVTWFLGATTWLGARVSVATDLATARQGVHGVRYALAAGFALQVLLAALSYLTPVMLAGGPATTRATNRIMDAAPAYRVVAANTCLALALVPALPVSARGACALAAGLVSAYSLLAMLRSALELRRRLRAKDDDILVRAIPIGPPAPSSSAQSMPVGALSPLTPARPATAPGTTGPAGPIAPTALAALTALTATPAAPSAPAPAAPTSPQPTPAPKDHADD